MRMFRSVHVSASVPESSDLDGEAPRGPFQEIGRDGAA
jgi:hypothetical protein